MNEGYLIKGEKILGFGKITATIDGGVGIPSVDIYTSGGDGKKNISFAFHNLKGEDGKSSEVEGVTMEQVNTAIDSAIYSSWEQAY